MALDYNILLAYIDGLYQDGSLSDQDYADIINYIVSNGNPEQDPRDLIQVRGGNAVDRPNFAQRELGFDLDTEELWIGGLSGNVLLNGGKIPFVNVKKPPHGLEALKGNNTAGDSARLQTIIDYYKNGNPNGEIGALLYFPTGTYFMDATVTIDKSSIYMLGCGVGISVFTRNADYGETFVFDKGDNTHMFYCGMRGFSIRTQSPMSNAHIKMRGLRVSKFSEMRLTGGVNSFEIVAGGSNYFNDIECISDDTCTIASSTSGRIHVYGDTLLPITQAGDTFFKGMNLKTTDGVVRDEYSILVRAADGIWFSDSHLGYAKTSAFRITPQSDALQTSGININNCWFDSGNKHGLLIDGDSTSAFGLINLIGCHLSGQGANNLDGNGVQIGDSVNPCNVSHVKIADNQIRWFDRHGVIVYDGKEINIDNNMIYENSFNTLDKGYGILIQNSAVDGCYIRGNRVGGKFTGAGDSNQVFGVAIATNVTNYIVTDNNLLGNTNSLSDGGIAPKVVADNLV